MLKNAGWLFLMLAVLWGGSGVAGAQTFDVTVSVTASIGKEGFSLDNSTVSAAVSTEWSGVKITSTTTFSLALALVSEVLVTSGKFGDYNWTDEMVIDFKNPIQDTFTLSTKMGDWNLTSVTVLKYTLDFSVFELVGETLKAATTTKDGVTLSSATTVNFEGFQKEVIAFSGSLSGLSISSKTDIGKSGLNSSTWVMGASVGDLSLSRTTVYKADGFFSDTLSVGGKYDKYNWTVTKTFGKTGWSICDLTVTTKMDRFDLTGYLSWTPEGFGGASLTASTTFKGLGAPPKEEPK